MGLVPHLQPISPMLSHTGIFVLVFWTLGRYPDYYNGGFGVFGKGKLAVPFIYGEGDVGCLF